MEKTIVPLLGSHLQSSIRSANKNRTHCEFAHSMVAAEELLQKHLAPFMSIITGHRGLSLVPSPCLSQKLAAICSITSPVDGLFQRIE